MCRPLRRRAGTWQACTWSYLGGMWQDWDMHGCKWTCPCLQTQMGVNRHACGRHVASRGHQRCTIIVHVPPRGGTETWQMCKQAHAALWYHLDRAGIQKACLCCHVLVLVYEWACLPPCISTGTWQVHEQVYPHHLVEVLGHSRFEPTLSCGVAVLGLAGIQTDIPEPPHSSTGT